MLTERSLERLEFVRINRVRFDKSFAQVLDEIQEDCPAAVSRRVDVDERTDRNFADTWSRSRRGSLRPMNRSIPAEHEYVFKTSIARSPCGEWRIADVGDVVGFMERDDPASLHERDRLGDDLFGLGNVDQHESRRDEIEFASWQSCRSGIPMNDLDVPEAVFSDHRSRHLYGIITALDADHSPGRTDTLGEEVKATVRAAADFDDTRPRLM